MASDINVDDLNDINDAMGEQIKLSQQLTSAWRKGSQEINRLSDAGGDFGSTFGKELAKTNSMTGALSKALRVAAKDTKKFGRAAGVAAAALKGMASAIELATKAANAMRGGFLSLGKSFLKLNFNLIIAPLKVVNALMKMANEIAQKRAEIAQKSQDLATQFGSQAKGLRQMAKGAGAVEKKFGNMFKFMSGEEYAAVGKAAEDLGDTFNALDANGLMPNIENTLILSKVLGLGATEMQALGTRALATGRDLNSFSDELVQQSYAMMEATGVAQKVISKDIGGIMADVANFGNITIKTAAVTAGRLRSLGTSFKSLAKITNKFMNFDNAAKSAAALGQAFGMALNPMKMMKNAAKDPIKNLEMLRKRMFAAGKSSEKMNAAQLRLLASQTGLSEQEAQLMFSQKNRGKSVKDLKKASKDQMSDADKMTAAVKNLTNEFSKMIEILSTGGIFENITKGFSDFMKSKGDLQSFQELNEKMYELGWKLGEVFQRLVDIGFFDKIIDNISKLLPLMDQLARPGGFFDLLMQGKFTEAFQDFDKTFQSVFGMGFKDAIMKALDYLAGMAAELVTAAAKALEEFFPMFEASLTGEGNVGQMESGFAKLFSAWGRFFKALWPYIELILAEICKGIYEWAKSNPKEAAYIVLALMALFSPAVLLKVAGLGIIGAGAFIGGFFSTIWNAMKGASFIFKPFQAAWNGFLSWLTGPGKIADKMFKPLYTVGQWFQSAGKWIKDVGSKFSTFFGNVFPKTSKFAGLLKGVGKLFGKLVTPVVFFWQGLKKMGEHLSRVKDIWTGTGSVISKVFDTIGSGIRAFLEWGAAFGDFLTFGFFNFEQGLIDSWAGLGDAFHWLFVEVIWGAFQDLGNWIRDAWNSTIEWFASVGQAFVDIITWPFKKAWEIIKSVWSWLLPGSLPPIMQEMIDGFAAAKDAIVNILLWPFKKAAKWVKKGWSMAKNLGSNLMKGLGDLKDKAKAKAKEVGKGIMDGIDSGVKKAKDIGRSAKKSVKRGLKKVGGWIGLGSPAKNLAKWIGRPMMQGINMGVEKEGKSKKFTGMFSKSLGFLKKFTKSGAGRKILGGLKKAGSWLLDGFGAPFKKSRALNSLKKGWGRVSSGMGDSLKKFWKFGSESKVMKQNGSWLIEGLDSGINTALDAMEAIGPAIAGKFGIDPNTGELSATGKGIQTAFQMIQTVVGGVQDIVKTMHDASDIEFDRAAAQSAMENAISDFESVMLGPDGMFRRIKKMNDKFQVEMIEMGLAGKKMQREMSEAGFGGAGNDQLVALGMLDISADEMMENKLQHLAGMHGQQRVRDTARAKTEDGKTALDRATGGTMLEMMGRGMSAFAEQQEAIQKQVGLVNSTLDSMSNLNESSKKIMKLGPSMTDNFNEAGVVMANAFESIGSMLYNANASGYNMGAYAGTFAEMYSYMQDAITDGNDLADLFQHEFLYGYIPELWDERIEAAVTLQGHIEALAMELATINTLVEGIPNIELKATIDDIEDHLSIVEEFTKIKDKPISINFALDIHLDAENLAKAMLQTENFKVHLPFKKTPPPK
tara:strand:+ start:5510 stop:10141 length:4632 start_codon:yes stop_codon:yes gene_type:complete